MIKGYIRASRQFWYYVYSCAAFVLAATIAWILVRQPDKSPSKLLALVVLLLVAARLGWILRRGLGRDDHPRRATLLASVGDGLATVGDLMPLARFGVTLRTVAFGAVFGVALGLASAFGSPLHQAFSTVVLIEALSELLWGRRD